MNKGGGGEDNDHGHKTQLRSVEYSMVPGTSVGGIVDSVCVCERKHTRYTSTGVRPSPENKEKETR